jgi:multidrug efflux pump subunit AcrA (membrane-fusion protein)
MVRRRLLVAPADGHIVEFYKEVGEACDEERTPVVRVTDTRRCEFVADCEARVWQRLQLQQRVKLEFDGREGLLAVEGVVQYVAPVVDPASGLLRIKVRFDNPDLRIRPGLAGRMTVD